jgi:hypothetical protein
MMPSGHEIINWVDGITWHGLPAHEPRSGVGPYSGQKASAQRQNSCGRSAHHRPLLRVRYDSNERERVKPIARHILNVMTLLSLVLCLMTASLWAWTCRWPDLSLGTTQLAPGRFQLDCWRGRLILKSHRTGVAPPSLWVLTTVYLIHDEADGRAFVQGLICDPSAPPWDPTDGQASQQRLRRWSQAGGSVLSRPSTAVPLWQPANLRNLGGFGANIVRFDLPTPSDGATSSWKSTPSRPVFWSFTLPLWLPAALFAALPLRSLLRAHRQRRRRNRRRCAACGYDLRATPDRCPECGRPAVRFIKQKFTPVK